ncbi:MAG: hypothetical protein M9891_17865 [Austwickia sp.]|nr:hypothetical protein [Actinomycetota bacterium]MCB1253597.1 hypothetical protein [Austwickia sp.]MCO5311117.1 hypothetical protein [Austwickia sp.]
MSEGYTWTYLDATGASVADAGTAAVFPSQGEAEAYLGESWQELADAGVGAVTLWRDGEVVYGPMSLEAAD